VVGPKVLLLIAVCMATPSPAGAQDFTPVRGDPNQSDVLVLRNGDRFTGEFRELQRGLVTFKTDAAATIYVKWPRVVTATTDKSFEIELTDGRTLVGSLAASETGYRVVIRSARDTLEVGITSIVSMIRIKKTFWERLDGSLDVGLGFTQQNSKLDLNLSTKIKYNIARNRFSLSYNGTLTRQDSVADIERQNLSGVYLREFRKRWFWAVASNLNRNSQLSLEGSWSLGTGPGRWLVFSNKVTLGTWIGLFYRTERYTNEDARTAIPLPLTIDFQWFAWSGLSTDVSSQLTAAPILNDAGRWQISFKANVKRELLSHLYLNIGVTELYDSKPPTDGNQNDFSFTTSIGWTF
jgi:hypothetical protein